MMSLSYAVPQVSGDAILGAVGLQSRELLRRNASAAIRRVFQGGQKLAKCEDAHTADAVLCLKFLHGGAVRLASFLAVQCQQYCDGRRPSRQDQVDGLAL